MGVSAVVALSAQALTSSFAESGYSPADATKRLLLKVTGSGVERVRQRGVVTPLDTAPAQVSWVGHDWLNGDVTFVVGGLSNQFSAVAVGSAALPVWEVGVLGLPIRDRKLYGGGYTIGTWHYFEEGVIRIDEPSGDTYTAHDPSSLPRGRLKFRTATGTPAWEQEADGVLVTRQLAGVTFPTADVGNGENPAWFYYHLTREWTAGSPGHHDVQITINTTTGDLEQIDGPFSPSASGQIGWRTDDDTQQIFTAAWMRAGWSDSSLSGTWGADPWSTPVMFEQITVDAHGDYPAGILDGGANDLYWPQVQFEGLNRSFGEKLEVRAVATNSPPTGILSGLWDSASWVEVGANLRANFYESSTYPQGRYLLLQFRLTPSPTVPLGGAPLVFQVNGAGDVLTAEAWDTAPPAPGGGIVLTPFTITNSEGTATATLPVPLQMPIETTRSRPVFETRTERGYTRSRPAYTADRRTWEGGDWIVTTTQRDTLITFFEARAGGAEPFTWTQPDGTTIDVLLLNDAVGWQWIGPDAWTVSEPVRLIEVLDA